MQWDDLEADFVLRDTEEVEEAPPGVRITAPRFRRYIASLGLPEAISWSSDVEERRLGVALRSLQPFLRPADGAEGEAEALERERRSVAALRQHWQRLMGSAPTSIEEDEAMLALGRVVPLAAQLHSAVTARLERKLLLRAVLSLLEGYDATLT